MFPQSKHLLVVLAFLLHNGLLFSQGTTDCPSPTFFKTFGEEGQAEYATSIIKSNDNHLFLAGRKGNRTFIQKMTTSGVIVWTRDFQVGPFEAVTPSEIILDSEGMIVGCGTQGSAGLSKGFVFRYNPTTNVLLWAHSITSNNPLVGGILEKGPGGNFILYQNALLGTGERDAEIIEIDRQTGVLNPSLAKRYEYISSDVFTKMVYVDGAIYASGTSSCRFGNINLVHSRQLLTRIDPGTFDPIWGHISHLDTLVQASFLGRDMVTDTNSLVTAYMGSSDLVVSGDANIFLMKTDLDGNILWVRKYSTITSVLKLLVLPDGYVIYGQTDGNKHVVIKTDKAGLPLWCRILTEFTPGNITASNFPPNQAVVVGDSLYFTGASTNGSVDVFFWKILTDGSMGDNSCPYVEGTPCAVDELIDNPFRALVDLKQVFSTATTAAVTPVLSDAELTLRQFCPDCSVPDPCPENNDFVVQINDVYCEQGKINMQFTYCDLDGGEVPPLTVSFFDANPYVLAANLLGSYEFTPNTSDSCWSAELTDLAAKFGAANVEHGDVIYAVVNVPGNAETPFSTAGFPTTDSLECDYTNNLGSYTIQYPAVPTLNLGADQSVCANEGAVLDAGPGFFKYQWSNGLTTQSITANFAGQFRVTVTDFCGFRQIDTINVEVRQAPVVTENGSFCPGKSVTVRGFEFDAPGIFQETIAGAGADCDTLITFFITQLPYQTRNEFVRFCPGETVTINGVTYEESGLAKDTLAGTIGCDTIIFYFLQELPLPFRLDTAFICLGDSVKVGDYYYSQPGLAFDTIPGTIGCDTLLRVQIILLPQVTIDSLVTFCPGTSVVIDGQSYDQPGLLTFTLPNNSGGCDTLLRYMLEWLPAPTRSETISFCQGSSVEIDGNTYTDPGTVLSTVPGVAGECDTLVTYTLAWLPAPTKSETILFCPGTSVEIDGNTYTQPGTVTATIAGAAGDCDTVVTYTLEWLPAPTKSETVLFCPGTSVEIDGNTYTQPGTVTATIAGAAGDCDTVVTYTLEWLPGPTRSETVLFCPGTSVEVAGSLYTQPGTVIATIPGVAGDCDTVVTYTLEWLPGPTRSETIQFCPGTSVQIGGNTYTQPGTVLNTVPGTGGGCDTVVTYTLAWLPYNTGAESITFCPGQTVFVGGNPYTQPGTVVDTIASTNGGCDVIVTYTLSFSSLPTRAETLTFCEGSSISLGGQSYTQPGVVTLTVPGASGACDTVVTYTLQFVDPQPSVLNAKCPFNVNVVTVPGTGPVVANYNQPTATSDCTCPGIAWTLTAGLPSGSLFPPGMTKVCYTATDSCGSTDDCCFDVIVREEGACDSKTIGCIKYDLLGITSDPQQRYTYKIRVTNMCANKLSYTAIQLPDGVVAVSPASNTIYESPEGRDYLVRNPNFAPFYSVRFKTTNDSISNGQSSVLQYTLPAQSHPLFIRVISRLEPQAFYETTLNTFNCVVGVTQSINRDLETDAFTTVHAEKTMLLYPNPTSGTLFADLSDWDGEQLDIRVLDSRGQRVQATRVVAGTEAQQVQLPEALPGGLYFLEIMTESGERTVGRFVVER